MSARPQDFWLFTRCVLALVIALNALGWAAHIDIPVAQRDTPGAHFHISAYAPLDTPDRVAPPTDTDNTQPAFNSDHCSHAEAHSAALIGAIESVTAPRPACAPVLAASHYTSPAFSPRLEPPIA